MEDRLTHEDTSMIVNALNYYSAWAVGCDSEKFQKFFDKKIENVITKFEKLEEQIMELRIKECE